MYDPPMITDLRQLASVACSIQNLETRISFCPNAGHAQGSECQGRSRRPQADTETLSLMFGIGKWICPGRHFVDATLFIVTSSVLSVFNVTKSTDEGGQKIPVKVAASISTANQRGLVV